jgi:hypothetical protein
MDNGGCIITYPVEGHVENIVKHAIRLGARNVILMDGNESHTNILNKFGLATDVRPILKDDISLVVSSVANLISDAKNNHDDVSVLLLPSDPVITTGVYIASCMEKVKVLISVSDFETKCITMPLFPFVNFSENEKFILTKIMENNEINVRDIFEKIKKEGRCDALCSRNYEPEVKERSLVRHLQRVLDKLEKMGLITREKRGRHFVWHLTSFGKLIFAQGSKAEY